MNGVRVFRLTFPLFQQASTYPDTTTTSRTYHPGGDPHISTDELLRTTAQDTALVTWTDSLNQIWTSFASITTDPAGFTTTSY